MRADRNSPLSANGQPAQEHRSKGDSAGSAPAADRPPGESLEPDALKLLAKQVRELGAYFSYYAAARADTFKLSLRNTLLGIVLGALGFVALSGLVVTAGWLLLIGLAEGLGVLCGDRAWVGNLLAGTLLLSGLAAGTSGMLLAHGRAARQRKVEEYEKRQARQATEFGRNVSERAAAAGTNGKRTPVFDRSGRECQNGDDADSD
jgi:hypothetical protein